MLSEPFCPVDTILLFTVFLLHCICVPDSFYRIVSVLMNKIFIHIHSFIHSFTKNRLPSADVPYPCTGVFNPLKFVYYRPKKAKRIRKWPCLLSVPVLTYRICISLEKAFGKTETTMLLARGYNYYERVN